MTARGLGPVVTIGICLSLAAACGGGGGSSRPAAAPPPAAVLGTGPAACTSGRADGFSCAGLALARHVTLPELGGSRGSDIWGWTDTADGRRYALVGLSDGVTFVDVTVPEQPAVVGKLPTATSASSWRDIKVANDTAYVVADAVGNHGMQVFDLTRLRVAVSGQTFSADLTYPDFGSAHNMAINEVSGFAYVVGSDTCQGGLHMIDISVPLNPLFAGCHGADGDTHDAQCVNYVGPDADHAGKELCFAANEDRFVVVDVSTKSAPVTVADFVYPGLGFVHQSWLTEDQRYLFIGDEADEQTLGGATRTIVVDVTDLDNPAYRYTHSASTQAIDHNMFVVGNRLYQANYTAGVRVLSFGDLSTDTLTEVAHFDTHPESGAAAFSGAWSVYPFFGNGTLIVSDINRGLFVLSE